MAKKNETIENIPVSDVETITNTVKEEVSIESVKTEKTISKQALIWKTYLEGIRVTPAAFLSRYPNSKYKIFIQELI
jgi:hypothetical protein